MYERWVRSLKWGEAESRGWDNSTSAGKTMQLAPYHLEKGLNNALRMSLLLIDALRLVVRQVRICWPLSEAGCMCICCMHASLNMTGAKISTACAQSTHSFTLTVSEVDCAMRIRNILSYGRVEQQSQLKYADVV